MNVLPFLLVLYCVDAFNVSSRSVDKIHCQMGFRSVCFQRQSPVHLICPPLYNYHRHQLTSSPNLPPTPLADSPRIDSWHVDSNYVLAAQVKICITAILFMYWTKRTHFNHWFSCICDNVTEWMIAIFEIFVEDDFWRFVRWVVKKIDPLKKNLFFCTPQKKFTESWP